MRFFPHQRFSNFLNSTLHELIFQELLEMLLLNSTFGGVVGDAQKEGLTNLQSTPIYAQTNKHKCEAYNYSFS
jgi:hypothetical protein